MWSPRSVACSTTCRSASSSPPPASRSLPPTVIRDRLAARLPLPGSGQRDAPARQRTLEGAVAWSHDLLDADRQDLLHRLGVFEGGFDLEQVDAVAGPSAPGGDRLDDLLELADQSLIVAVPTTRGRARFRMLRTIQSFALDRLAGDGHRGRRSPAPCRGLPRAGDGGRRPAEHVAPWRMAGPHGAGAWPTFERPCAGRSMPARAASPFAWRPRCGASGRPPGWSPRVASWPSRRWRCRSSNERIGPRVGPVRGREPRLLAGRLGGGAPTLRGTDRRRRGGGRRGVCRGCVLQHRPRPVRGGR